MNFKEQELLYQPVDLNYRAIAQKAYESYEQRYPDIINGYNAYQKARTLEDFSYHIQYIGESLAVSDAAILIDYAKWANVLLSSLGLPKNCLSSGLEVLMEVLDRELPEEQSRKSHEYIEQCLLMLTKAPTTVPSFITDDNPLRQVANEYLTLLLHGDRAKAHDLVMDLVNSGTPVRDVYLLIFQPVLRETGRLWQMQEISVAQEHYITASTQQILAQFYHLFIAGNKKIVKRGRTVIAACVSGELHEVGMRIVADFLEMDGWDTYYIGSNSPSNSVIQAVRERKVSIVAISSTMSFHIPQVYSLIKALRSSPDTKEVAIIIGGYPFNIMPDLWKKVEADAYAPSAEAAVSLADWLIS
ncbi:MAG: cobalamin-dependent protein [Methanomicrobiales archaeon]